MKPHSLNIKICRGSMWSQIFSSRLLLNWNTEFEGLKHSAMHQKNSEVHIMMAICWHNDLKTTIKSRAERFYLEAYQDSLSLINNRKPKNLSFEHFLRQLFPQKRWYLADLTPPMKRIGASRQRFDKTDGWTKHKPKRSTLGKSGVLKMSYTNITER